jgi:predicted MPP superfamily phosphohydrolase
MLFALIASSVYLGMNWYVLYRLFRLFGLGRGGWFYLALALLTLSLISALSLESRFGHYLTGAFFTVAVTWLGLCWMLLWILFVQQVLALLIPAPQRMWAIGVCGLAAGLALYAGINARTITIRREQIPRLPLKVAHLSDIHIGSIGAAALDDIIAKTNALKPDAILITGDLFDNTNPRTRALAARLNGFTAPVVFASGNHETYTGYDHVRQMLAGTRIRWLRNEMLELNGTRIIGVENSYSTELVQSVLDKIPPSPAFTILMNHQPNSFDIAARHRVDLTLSGHVHNGQIWPFNYVVGLIYPYRRGVHENAGSFLNVSTGTGFWGPPLRLGSHSEIVFLEPKS